MYNEREEKGEYYLLVKELRLQDAGYCFEFCRQCNNCLCQGYNVGAESSIILACSWLSTDPILARSEKFKVPFIFFWLRRAKLISVILS